jgi:CelD/BcsL family acetyltransferase involved in cellulose biosynthesis
VTPEWNIVEFRGIRGLEQLEADWRRLLDEMPGHTPHQTYEAFHAFFTHVNRGDGRLICLALTDGQCVRAICPLEPSTTRILGFQTKVWGLPWRLWDIGHDIICPPGEAERRLLPAVISFLRRAPDRPKWLLFRAVLDDSALSRCLRALDSRAYVSEVIGACDVLDCTMSFEELSSRFSRNFRSSLRRDRKKLAALSGVRFASTSDRAGVEREFEDFLELEASGWKGDASVRGAIRLRPDQLAFYRELIATFGDSNRLEFNTMFAEGRLIASQLCVRSGTTYTALKIAYDESYARVAPGQLLLERTLERCCRDPQIRRLNLVNNLSWHRNWRPENIPARAVYLGIGAWTGRPLVRLLRMRLDYGPVAKRLLRPFRSLRPSGAAT